MKMVAYITVLLLALHMTSAQYYYGRNYGHNYGNYQRYYGSPETDDSSEFNDSPEFDDSVEYRPAHPQPKDFHRHKTIGHQPQKTPVNPYDLMFNNFITKYNKRYANEREKTMRKGIFETNAREIENHNRLYQQGRTTYMKGINENTDMTKEEVLKKNSCLQTKNALNQGTGSYRGKRYNPVGISQYLPPDDDEIDPPTLDYRLDLFKNNPVEMQGNAGFCWVFAITATMEAIIKMDYNEDLKLSKQYLIDCYETKKEDLDPNDPNNEGEDAPGAYKYIAKNGIPTQDAYGKPYTAKRGECNGQNVAKIKYQITEKVSHVDMTNEVHLISAFNVLGPIHIGAYYTSEWDDWNGEGVLDVPLCGEGGAVNHAMVLVGYGTMKVNNKETPYWIIRNSYSDQVGKEGYFLTTRPGNEKCTMIVKDYGKLPRYGLIPIFKENIQ